MKKTFLLPLVFVAQMSIAQETSFIGKLRIGNDGIYDTTFDSGGVSLMQMGFDSATGYVKFGAHTGNGFRHDILYMRGSDGNVGVGTANPLAKLQVNGGNILVRNYANVDNESAIMIAHSIDVTTYDTYGTSIRTITQSAGNNTYGLQFFTQESYLKPQTEKLRILGNGNVGIGEINPTNKLDVNGTIHSKEVKVDMKDWSDFVFKKEYNLPTLEEVEKHIAEKGHLENIPSEEEVLKEGINLGEMSAKLLQKIEELTLYMIEMKKENENMKKENMEMKKENEKFHRNQRNLEERIKRIETL